MRQPWTESAARKKRRKKRSKKTHKKKKKNFDEQVVDKRANRLEVDEPSIERSICRAAKLSVN